MIKLLFFAQLAEQAGQEMLSLDYQDGVTPRAIIDVLEADMPKPLIESLRFDAVMVSINKAIASWDDTLNDGDEVAFLPPFSGG